MRKLIIMFYQSHYGGVETPKRLRALEIDWLGLLHAKPNE